MSFAAVGSFRARSAVCSDVAIAVCPSASVALSRKFSPGRAENENERGGRRENVLQSNVSFFGFKTQKTSPPESAGFSVRTEHFPSFSRRIAAASAKASPFSAVTYATPDTVSIAGEKEGTKQKPSRMARVAVPAGMPRLPGAYAVRIAPEMKWS